MKYLITLLLIITGCAPSSYDHLRSSVEITNMARNSGGSGVILSSSETESIILTNSHVCKLIEVGGLVTTFDGQTHSVYQYVEFTEHDLCAIKVKEDLHVDTNIATRAPLPGELATVIGHPSLLPTTVTQGIISAKLSISVLTGTRNCTETELANPNLALVCALLGSLPIIKTYEALYMSNLIMPGSSGSPVFNSAGDLEALVFAGKGDLSFGFAVPYEYLITFINILPTIEFKSPTNEVPLVSNEHETVTPAYRSKLTGICSKMTSDIPEFCGIFK